MKTLLPILCLLVFLCCLISCDQNEDKSDDDNVSGQDDDDDNDNNDDNDDDASYPFCEVDEARVDELLKSMTLRDKIAQMYVVGVQVLPWFDVGNAKRLVEQIGVGGVFIQPGTGLGLWPEWTVANTNKLQTWATGRNTPIPLLIVCDQEGGIPQAVSDVTGGTDTPGNLGIGAAFDPQVSFDSYSIMGQQLFELGINNAYAPVAELTVSPDEPSMYTRCFGQDTQDVSANTKQAVRGFQSNLIVATAKHFPGHSTAPGDEHTELTINDDSESDVRKYNLPPFEAAIEAEVDMMMITHSNYRAWEPSLPTTFSKKIVTTLLRDELGYEGLIVTDDMNMGSIMNLPWDEHPDVLAVFAGVDLVLDTGADGDAAYGIHPANEQWDFKVAGQIEAVEQAVNEGRIDADQIDDSVRRILRTKMKYCLFDNPFRDGQTVRQKMDTEEQRNLAKLLHQKAITLVRNDDGLWPLDPDAGQKVHVVSISPFQSQMYPGAYWGNIASTSLLTEIKNILPDATGTLFDVEPSANYIDATVDAAEQADPDVLVIGTYHAYYHEDQQNLVRALLDLGRPAIMVAFALPYDLIALPEVTTYLATYSNRDIAAQTAAKAIFGLIEPEGKLPVDLPGLYEYGHSAVK